uniref:Uncharacterized protein n=1 Tax=Panagrolaimus sp. PS1159 TaxID=55785 RepID=A0AC35F2M0_9BILA
MASTKRVLVRPTFDAAVELPEIDFLEVLPPPENSKTRIENWLITSAAALNSYRQIRLYMQQERNPALNSYRQIRLHMQQERNRNRQQMRQRQRKSNNNNPPENYYKSNQVAPRARMEDAAAVSKSWKEAFQRFKQFDRKEIEKFKKKNYCRDRLAAKENESKKKSNK